MTTNYNYEGVYCANRYIIMIYSTPTIKGVDWQPVKPSGELDYVLIKSPKEIKPQKGKNIGQQNFWESLMLREYDRLYSIKDEL